MKTFEVELKYEAPDNDGLKTWLSDAEVVARKVQEDIYYDTKDADLFKRRIFLRVRDGKRIDFKFNFESDEHEGCHEHSFDLPIKQGKLDSINGTLKYLGMTPLEEADFDAFLQSNSLGVFVPIRKETVKYSKDGYRISHDVIKGLGSYVEIETHASNEADAKRFAEDIKALGNKLGMKLVTTGYVELYLRKHDFDLYKQGAYLLEEDK